MQVFHKYWLLNANISDLYKRKKKNEEVYLPYIMLTFVICSIFKMYNTAIFIIILNIFICLNFKFKRK